MVGAIETSVLEIEEKWVATVSGVNNEVELDRVRQNNISNSILR